MMFFISLESVSENVTCNGKSFNAQDIKEIKEFFLNSEREKIIKRSVFPMQGQTNGYSYKMNDAILNMDWRKLNSEDHVAIVSNSSLCDLVNIFGLEFRGPKNNNLKITQMIFYTDEKDLRYVFSGFTSAKNLFSFVKKINLLIDSNKYEELSKFIEYPSSSIDEVKIRKSSDFINAAEKIITPKVKKLLKAAETGGNFTLLNQGIMLNSRGDVWLVSYVDKGTLIRINDPR